MAERVEEQKMRKAILETTKKSIKFDMIKKANQRCDDTCSSYKYTNKPVQRCRYYNSVHKHHQYPASHGTAKLWIQQPNWDGVHKQQQTGAEGDWQRKVKRSTWDVLEQCLGKDTNKRL